MEHLYLLLDDQCNPLAQAVLESPLGAEVLQLRVLDGAVGRVTGHKEIQLVGLDSSTPARAGVITHTRGDQLVVQPTAFLGENARENLRVNVSFRSFLYPVSGQWKGRQTILGKDLSCGGIAFHCARSLQPREIAEIVLPVTDAPLLLKVQILRTLPTKAPVPLYAAKFVDMIQDEEFMIRKAVFSIQVSGVR